MHDATIFALNRGAFFAAIGSLVSLIVLAINGYRDRLSSALPIWPKVRQIELPDFKTAELATVRELNDFYLDADP